MIVGIISRILAATFLLFHAFIFIGVAVRSLRDVVNRSEDTNVLISAMFLLFSVVFTVWVWGLLQNVFKKNWPRKTFIRLQADWRKYLATLFVLVGLVMLFGTSVGFYVSLGHAIGTQFGLLAQMEYAYLLNVQLPAFLISVVAWVFEWQFASFMVGFCVWIFAAVAGAASGKKSAKVDIEKAPDSAGDKK